MKRAIVFILAAFLLASCGGSRSTPYPTPPIPKEIKIISMTTEKARNGIVVSGMVENLGQGIVPLIKISCYAYAADGNVAQSGWTYAVPNDLEPGDRATFILLLKTMKTITEYECSGYIVAD